MCADTTTKSPTTPIATLAAVARAGGAAAGSTWMATVGRHLANLCDGILAATERWRQRRALMALDDHLLSDIGVSRADVEREIGKSIWRD